MEDEVAVVDGFWVWAYAHCTHRMVIWLNGGGMHLPALPIRTEGVFKVRLAGESARVLYIVWHLFTVHVITD